MKKFEKLEKAEKAAREFIEKLTAYPILGVFAEKVTTGYYVTITYDDGVRKGFLNRYVVALDNKYIVTQCAKFEKINEVFL